MTEEQPIYISKVNRGYCSKCGKYFCCTGAKVIKRGEPCLICGEIAELWKVDPKKVDEFIDMQAERKKENE